MAQSASKNWVAKSREKIRTSALMDRLMKHADGEIEMTKSQITVALALVRKVLPDLSHATVEALVDDRRDRDKPTSKIYAELLMLEDGPGSEEG